jgi:hypothetical protein
VLSSVAADRDDESLAHQALLYGSEEEFLAGTVAFIRVDWIAVTQSGW